MAKIRNNANLVKQAIDAFFGGGSMPMSGMANYNTQGSSVSTMSMAKSNYGEPASFLDKGTNDPAILRKRLSELEIENKRLKE